MLGNSIGCCRIQLQADCRLDHQCSHKACVTNKQFASPKVAFKATAFSRPIGLTCHPVIASTGVQWGYASADVKHQSCHLGLGCIDDSGEVLGARGGN